MIREELADGISLYCGDCLDVLKAMEPNSVDSIVSDPPYGLKFMGREWDGADGFRRSLNKADTERDSVFGRTSKRGPEYKAGSLYQEFMHAVGIECLRVLKPGGHLVMFSGTRTYHRMVCGLEDAGFEIRDQLAWIYGVGFPKSKNISRGDEFCQCQANSNSECDMRSLRQSNVQEAVPQTASQRSEESRIVARQPQSQNGGAWPHCGRCGKPMVAEGLGTALKPAQEPIVLARKPLSESTVAANVLKWGTGALNIDACRIETNDDLNGGAYAKNASTREQMWGESAGNSWKRGGAGEYVKPVGRWPANVCHDGSDEVVSLFPYTKSGAMKRTVEAYDGDNVTGFLRGRSGPQNQRADEGSAARFFYCSKATRADRAGSRHPTVKPINLMQWLTRLVTPPNGIVLDPFAGTGTTAAACHREGFQCIMIEREEEYQDDIRRRVESFGRTPEVESPSIVPQDQQATLF